MIFLYVYKLSQITFTKRTLMKYDASTTSFLTTAHKKITNTQQTYISENKL